MRDKTRYYFLLTVSLNLFFSACSQDSSQFYQLGSSSIEIKTFHYTSQSELLFVQLHHNEQTAGEVAQRFCDSLAIGFLQINNRGERLIDFRLNGNVYRFDPNRIFSKEGVAASLSLHSKYSDEASAVVDTFSRWLLNLFNTRTIIALHNNSDEEFTLNDYRHNKTGLIHQNPLLDADDFFITTDSTIYEGLKAKNFNAVWEWSNKLKDDGSLSVYCYRSNIVYVNIEAEHGHAEQQQAMLVALLQILNEKKK